MAQIVFQGLNDLENPMFINQTQIRILKSQGIYVDIDNESGIVEFNINNSAVPAEYQAKSIKMIMDEFVNYSRQGFNQRCYIDRQKRMLDEIIETIQNNDVLEF